MKKYIMLTVLAFLTTLFYSCDEGSIKNKTNGFPQRNSNQTNTYADIQNPNNPYNYVGVYHNDALDNYIDTYNSQSTDETVFNDAYAWGIANQYSGYDHDLYTSFTYGQYLTIVSYTFADIYNSNDVSQNFKDYLLQIETKSDTTLTVTNSIMQLTTLEDDIVTDINVSSIDQATLLATIALAKHSIMFWELNEPTPTSKVSGKAKADLVAFAVAEAIDSTWMAFATAISGGALGPVAVAAVTARATIAAAAASAIHKEKAT